MRNFWRLSSKLAWCVVALVFGIAGSAQAQVGQQSVFVEAVPPSFNLTVNSTDAPSSGTCTDLQSNLPGPRLEIEPIEGWGNSAYFAAKCHFVNLDYWVQFVTTRIERAGDLFRPTHVEVSVRVAFWRDDDPDQNELYVLRYKQEVELSQLTGFSFDAEWFTHYPGVLFHNVTEQMIPLL